MSDFIYHRNNHHRYNIYETYVQPTKATSYYEQLRSLLLVVAITLSCLLASFIAYDLYQKQKMNQTQMLLYSKMQQNLARKEITSSLLTSVISKSIIQKQKEEKSFKKINTIQLKRIIQNVMEKIENSPRIVIYHHQ